jgi:hypothetical protein
MKKINKNINKKMGRASVFNESTLQKLEQVFSLGGNDQEACEYSNISPSSLYNYQVKHPEFLERKQLLKTKLILRARQAVVNSLDIPEIAFKYLKCKCREEFSEKNYQEDEGNRKSLDAMTEVLKKLAEK